VKSETTRYLRKGNVTLSVRHSTCNKSVGASVVRPLVNCSLLSHVESLNGISSIDGFQ
jgi:hypothetical protein